ncbi:MAG: hypothetical protein LBR34_05445 [Prevotella sp.]|nr:hypothetical protein [Prevotella sp.]
MQTGKSKNKKFKDVLKITCGDAVKRPDKVALVASAQRLVAQVVFFLKPIGYATITATNSNLSKYRHPTNFFCCIFVPVGSAYADFGNNL